MQRIRDTLALHSRWTELSIYVDRMEAHLESDFSLSIENAKAMLESIGKEICTAKGIELGSAPSINAVLKKAFSGIGYSGDHLVAQVSGALATIGQNLGDLRNEISPTSHGKSLDALKERNSTVDVLTREFLMDSTVVVAVFLIRAFEERQAVQQHPVPHTAPIVILDYEKNQAFNDYWDGAFGDFSMGAHTYSASEILFRMNTNAYLAECQEFEAAERDTPPEESI
jgi:hypothetical protein